MKRKQVHGARKTNSLIKPVTNLVGAIIALAGINTCDGIEGLKISVHCPDVVLSWPSSETESYIVQYRPTLDVSSPWTTLTNGMVGASGTNSTTFIDPNMVDCPSGQVFRLGGDGTGKASLSTFETQEEEDLQEQYEIERLAALLARCEEEGRTPLLWELENRPPYPWEDTTPLMALSSDPTIPPGAGEGVDSEQVLGTGFYRVVRTGPSLFGLTNGSTVTGVECIPVELGITNEDFAGVGLFIQDVEVPGAIVDTNGTGQWMLEWDTTLLPNGTYEIQLQADVDMGLPPAKSPNRTVTVDNNVSTDEFMISFGSQMWIYAELKPGAGDYEIAIHDGDTGAYLGSFFESTSDGVISLTWDLSDGMGGVFTNEIFREDYYLLPPQGASEGLSAPGGGFIQGGVAAAGGGLSGSWFLGSLSRYKEKTWTSDRFVTAAGEFEYPSGTVAAIDQMMQWSVNNMLANPLANQPYTLNPPNGWDTGTSFYLEESTKATLLAQLGDPLYRNFFWFGHGGRRGIGYRYRDENNNPSGGIRIYAREIRKALGNRGRIRHGYRLVFAYGCLAISGPVPRAFGIYSRPVAVGHYQSKGMKSRAMVGSPVEHEGFFYPAEYAQVGESFTIFFGNWMGGATVTACLNAAQTPPGPNETRIALDPSYEINGAVDLTRNAP